jgi:4-hydroxy-2-oxoheptanedioate aldolase
MDNKLKQQLRSGDKPLGTFCGLNSPTVIECLGRTGLDFVIVDCEHSPSEAETAMELIRAAELSNLTPLCRVRDLSRSAVLKLLDVGARGLIVPNIHSVEEVQQVIDWAKFAPIGQRGFCPTRKDGWGFDTERTTAETMAVMNEATLLLPQCETKEALENIEAITAMEGVDGIFIGPFDLSISMGLPGQFDHPTMQAAFARIRKACRESGKFCFLFTGSPAGVAEGFATGYDAMVLGIDTLLLISGVKMQVEAARKATEA